MSVTNLVIAGAHQRTQKGNNDYYYGGGDEAWLTLAAAYAGIPAPIRPGKTFGVYQGGQISEYWWPDAVHTGNGQEVAKGSGGGGGSADLGNWNALVGLSNFIYTQNIDLEYKIDSQSTPAKKIVYLRGQFSLAGFNNTSLTLGVLPDGLTPKGQIKRLIESNGIMMYLIIEPTGEVKLLSRDGFNLPSGEDVDQYSISEFFKPYTAIIIDPPGGQPPLGPNEVSAANQALGVPEVRISNAADVQVLDLDIPAGTTVTDTVDPNDGPFSVTILYDDGTTALSVNNDYRAIGPGPGSETFLNKNAPIDIVIS